jgi:hypothetical protein
MRTLDITKAPSFGAFLFIAAFGMYAFTAAPSVTFWDSGELIAAAHTLGIPHQPGYPLYCILAKAFSFIPIGSIAFKANILSASSAAISVYMLYASLRLLLAGRNVDASFQGDMAAAAVASLFAVSKALWTQAAVAEVYGLNALFVTMLVYLHILNSRGRVSCVRYIALSGFLFGLGFVNHITFGLLLPGLLASWYLALRGNGYWLKASAAGIAFGVSGMSVLIYLPIRSTALPYINIGRPGTLGDFMWTVRWGAYLDQLMSLTRSVPGHLSMAGSDLSNIIIAASGLLVSGALAWTLVRSNLRTYLPLIVFAVIYIPVISGISLSSGREVGFGLHEKFFIPAIAFGLIFIAGIIGSMFDRNPSGKRATLCYAVTVVCICASSFLVTANLPATDYHKHFIAYDYAQNSLKSTGERGVLLTWGDNGVFPLWYVQGVEEYRDDVLLSHTPLMTYDWYLADINRRSGMDIKYMEAYYLGENTYRVMKADPTRPFCYDYSTVRNLELSENDLTPRGLVYFEGYVPPGDPWDYFVFRGARERDVPIGKLEDNILQIYTYMARLEPEDE